VPELDETEIPDDGSGVHNHTDPHEDIYTKVPELDETEISDDGVHNHR